MTVTIGQKVIWQPSPLLRVEALPDAAGRVKCAILEDRWQHLGEVFPGYVGYAFPLVTDLVAA